LPFSNKVWTANGSMSWPESRNASSASACVAQSHSGVGCCCSCNTLDLAAGPADDPGINSRALVELFKVANERSAEVSYSLSASVLEIYNEQIFDLLAGSKDTGGPRHHLQPLDRAQERACIQCCTHRGSILPCVWAVGAGEAWVGEYWVKLAEEPPSASPTAHPPTPHQPRGTAQMHKGEHGMACSQVWGSRHSWSGWRSLAAHH